MQSIIEAKSIFIKYDKNTVIENISFLIEKGDFIGLAGPNGAGKTTLIKAMLGLIPLTSGEFYIFNQKQKKFSDFSKIGYLPQKNSGVNILFPASVGEVVLLGLLAKKKKFKIVTQKDKKTVDEILEKLQIDNLRNKMFSELSGGQQQKVLLARALVSRPELLIFDEPSTALDPESRNYFFNFIQELNKKDGVSVILITHDTGYIGEYANKLMYVDKKLIYFGKMNNFCDSDDANFCFEKKNKHIIWHQHT